MKGKVPLIERDLPGHPLCPRENFNPVGYLIIGEVSRDRNKGSFPGQGDDPQHIEASRAGGWWGGLVVGWQVAWLMVAQAGGQAGGWLVGQAGGRSSR